MSRFVNSCGRYGMRSKPLKPARIDQPNTVSDLARNFPIDSVLKMFSDLEKSWKPFPGSEPKTVVDVILDDIG